MSSRSSAEPHDLPAPASLAIHLDLVGGIAGDMFVAAMVDALPALEARVLDALAAAQPRGAPAARFFGATSGGLRARRFGVDAAAPALRYRSAARKDATGIARVPPAHGGTPYTALRDHIAGAPLPAATREHALQLLMLLARAEADVHGAALEDVHFHELADWDSLMDVVAAGCIAASLEGARWSASAPPLGSGLVRTAHGMLPVPTPATAGLLTGYPWRDDGIAGERVTPTGAAILRHLVEPARCGASRCDGILLATGYGCGTRALAGLPNVVRALVIEPRAGAPAGHAPDRPSFAERDRVCTLAFDVDDMTGEEIAVAADHLRAARGVIDVTIGTRFGKKGRGVADFRVLAQATALHDVARACFSETSTLGLRVREEERLLLRRTEVVQSAEGRSVRVKVAERPGGARTAKADSDDVAGDQGLRTRRAVRGGAAQRALKRRRA
jgi:uncharacterized protein (TIGR00299 family) protein